MLWMALKTSTAAQLVPKMKAQVFASIFSSECLIIRHHAATPVRNQAAQVPGPYTPLTFAIPKGSGVEVVILRYNGDITAMVVEVEIVMIVLRWMESIRAALVAPEKGEVADARRLGVVRNANPSVA
jgi:hypothetical protein